MHPLFDLTGKVAVVTCCAAEMACSMVSGLAEAGADIIGIDSREPVEAKAAAEKFGRKFVWTEGSIAQLDSVPSLMERAAAAFGHIDVLVGYSDYIGERVPVDEMTWEAYMESVDSNQNAVARVAMEAYRRMKAQGVGGKIVLVSSSRAYRTGEGGFGYTTGKTGVLGLVKSLGIDGAQYGIWVNGIAPGVIETERVREGYSAYTEEAKEMMKLLTEAMHPARRLGTPEDVRGAVVFLASKASDFIVGQVIGIDGGNIVRH